MSKNTLYIENLYKWLNENKYIYAPSTYCKYNLLINNYIEPFFDELKFNDITESTLENFHEYIANKKSKKTSEGLSKETLQSISFLINKGLELTGNKLKFKLRIKREKNVLTIFSHTEQVILEQYLRAHLNSTEFCILLCLYTGIRIGELCALKWSDFDITDKCIRISKTAQRINTIGKTQLIISSPKTISSKRVIPIADSIFKEVVFFKNASEHDVYITNQCKNTPLDPRTMQYRYKNVLNKATVDYKNFHTLRHTFATRCLNAGMDIKTLSEILGHASIKTTLECYCHISLEHKKEQINLLTSLS